MLLTDRRRLFGRREEDDGRDPHQGSLFASDGLAAAAARSPGATTPDPFAAPGPRSAQIDAPESVATVAAPPAPVPDTSFAPGDDDGETIASEDELTELEPVHAGVAASRSVLAGPTLDDVMSRVWEGLRAEVPTPCPVCHTEIEPSAHGHCGGCGSTLR